MLSTLLEKDSALSIAVLSTQKLQLLRTCQWRLSCSQADGVQGDAAEAVQGGACPVAGAGEGQELRQRRERRQRVLVQRDYGRH